MDKNVNLKIGQELITFLSKVSTGVWAPKTLQNIATIYFHLQQEHSANARRIIEVQEVMLAKLQSKKLVHSL